MLTMLPFNLIAIWLLARRSDVEPATAAKRSRWNALLCTVVGLVAIARTFITWFHDVESALIEGVQRSPLPPTPTVDSPVPATSITVAGMVLPIGAALYLRKRR